MTSRKKPQSPYFPCLDGVRGLAAAAVMVHHFCRVGEGSPLLKRFPTYYAVTGKGAFGVDVFFVLSGFVITLILLNDRTKAAYFQDFYWKRALRILPVYFVHLAAWEYFTPHGHMYVILSLLFIVNFGWLFPGNFEGPTWTLAIEEQFYIIWPQFVRRFQLRNLFRLAVGMGALSIVLRFCVSYFHGGFVAHNTVFRLDGLALGSLAALQWFRKEEAGPIVSQILKIVNSPWTLVPVAGLTIAVSIIPIFDHFILAATLTTVNIFTYQLVRLLVASKVPTSLVWLESRPLRWLGAVSYAMYMFHPILFPSFDRLLGPVSPDYPGWMIVRFLLESGCVLAICAISRTYLEIPVQRLRGFVLAKREPESFAIPEGVGAGEHLTPLTSPDAKSLR